MISLLKPFITNIFILGLILLALVLYLLFKKSPGLIKKSLIIVSLIWVSATRPIAEIILYPLENAFHTPSLEEIRSSGVRDIVVLTGGADPIGNNVLISEVLQNSTRARFLAGLELASQLGTDYRLIFTGSSTEVKTAMQMALLAKTLQPDRIVLIDTLSFTTKEHPVNVKPLLQNIKLVLVTSACHTPRSVSVFKKNGLDPIPFPANKLFDSEYDWTSFLPYFSNYDKINLALYEYLGLMLYIFVT